jgi:dihydropteroate synthase
MGKILYFCKMISFSLNIDGDIRWFNAPLVMGILNLTPDSFHAPSRYAFDAVDEADIVDIGACSTRPGIWSNKKKRTDKDIVDIGACSTRPGAEVCSESEEMERLMKAAETIKERYSGKILSVDTFRPAVAEMAIKELGVHIVNDISGGCEDIYSVAARYGRAYVLTYPEPGGMDKALYWFSEKIDALARAGVNDIIIDPGFGFNKDVEQNYALVREFEVFKSLRLPILCGISRKRMVYQLLGITPGEALNGTSVANTILLTKGADILRVHDVKEAVEAVKIYQLSTVNCQLSTK